MAETTSTTPAYVVVARHGERLDYKERDAGRNWVAQQVDARPFDPPLTEHGKQQGLALGRHLAKELDKLGAPPLTAIYSSPFLRCRQTAVSALNGYNAALQDKGDRQAPHVRVELGLAESINESWYRSWALPGSDGTWGYRPDKNAIDPGTLHPRSKEPVQSLLNVSDWTDDTRALLDLDYTSVTTLDEPYCFEPRHLETRQDQRRRMLDVVMRLARPGQTLLLVSHGGPVTHLYEELSGNHWSVHGESSYCCYSIYEQAEAAQSADQPTSWKPIAVNESNYLHETAIFERHVSEEEAPPQNLPN